MTNLDLFQSAKITDPLAFTAAILGEFPLQFAAVTGLDKKPQVHPLSFCFEKGETLYFAVAKSSRFYAELSADPHIQICVYDPETLTTFRLSAVVSFTEEKELTDACLTHNETLRKQWGDQPEMLIAFFLRGVRAELSSLSEEIEDCTYLLPDSDLAPVGLTIKKKKELKDRLESILKERADKGSLSLSGEELEYQKLYDGALALMAEAGKKLWTRMNVQILENVLLYETYNEREDYMRCAGKLLGNAVIDKPEDFTYLLSSEVLKL